MTQYDSDNIEPAELQRRVVYSLLRPSIRLAAAFGISLREMKEWVGVSFLHELKRLGLNQHQSAERIDVSRRTVIALTKKLRENFFEPERHGGLMRRVIFMLWAEPMTGGRIKQALSHEVEREAEIDEALTALVARGDVVVTEREGGLAPLYDLDRSSFRLYRRNWIARVDALNDQLDHIADTVFARFFAADPTRGFARTVTLSVAKGDREELERLYREVVFPALARLDERSRDHKDEEVELMQFSISWSPKDFLDAQSPATDD